MTELAIPVASSMASSLVEGFNFQFPVMKGFRANSWLSTRAADWLWGANAEASLARRQVSQRAKIEDLIMVKLFNKRADWNIIISDSSLFSVTTFEHTSFSTEEIRVGWSSLLETSSTKA